MELILLFGGLSFFSGVAFMVGQRVSFWAMDKLIEGWEKRK